MELRSSTGPLLACPLKDTKVSGSQDCALHLRDLILRHLGGTPRCSHLMISRILTGLTILTVLMVLTELTKLKDLTDRLRRNIHEAELELQNLFSRPWSWRLPSLGGSAS